MEQFLNNLNRSPQKRELLPILQNYQNEHGYLTHDFILALSKEIGIPAGHIFGTASFYSQFKFTPSSKYHIKICSGTSCHINNIESIEQEIFKHTGLSTKQQSNNKYSFERVGCLGACAQGPVIEINGKFFTKVKSSQIREIFSNFI